MQGLLDTICEVVVGLDHSWCCTYFNSRAEEVLGKKASDVLGKTLWEAFPEQIPSGEVHPKLLEAQQTGQPQIFEYQFAPQDRWHEVRVYPHDEGITMIALDITEKKRLDVAHDAHDAQLEMTRRELEATVQSKDRFIAQVSHELRTPLTPVMINISLLEEMFAKDGDASRLVNVIRRNLQHEIRLIDDLLDATRIANGKLTLKRQSVRLHAVLANAVTLTKHVIEDKGLQLDLALHATDDMLWADETRIQQVFWNLLHNATKFAPRRSSIRIRTATRAGYAIVTIDDEGVGIDPEDLPRIFDPFEQTDPNVTLQFGGLGLGLTITRSLVHLHGGYITAHSEGKGKGSTFRVQLPLKSYNDDLTDKPATHYQDLVGYSTDDLEPRLVTTPKRG